MNDNVQHAYQIFVNKCEDVTASRYIMSGNKIIGLLRYLAATPCLMEYISKCNQGFRYREEFERATSSILFRMPTEPSKVVALVTGMLYEIDRNRLNINSFLMKFYGNDDYEESYRLFCKGIIEPYSRALGQVIADGIEPEDEPLQTESRLPVSEAVKEQIYPYICAIEETLESGAALTQERADDMRTMTEGLKYAFEMAGTKMIKIVWTGMRSVFAGYKPTVSYIRAIEKILVSYAIL